MFKNQISYTCLVQFTGFLTFAPIGRFTQALNAGVRSINYHILILPASNVKIPSLSYLGRDIAARNITFTKIVHV